MTFLKTCSTYVFIFLLGGFVFKITNDAFFENSDEKKTRPESVAELNNEPFKITDNPDDDDYLNKLLIEYEKKIESLLDENETLVGKYLSSNTQLQALTTKPSIEKKIKNMSDSDLRNKINLVIDDSQFSDIHDTKAFASRLAEVAMESPDDKSGSTDSTNIDVRISISRTIGYQEMTTSGVVASKYRRLYANILSSEVLDYVLVKWKNVSTDEFLFYKGLTFNPNSDSQFIWTKPRDGWETGVYQINIYKIDDKMELLAEKRFTITDVFEDGSEETDPPVEGVSIRKKPVN